MIAYIDYIQEESKNAFVEHDVKTITAGDFTIEFDITADNHKFWRTFQSKINQAETIKELKTAHDTKYRKPHNQTVA